MFIEEVLFGNIFDGQLFCILYSCYYLFHFFWL